MPFDEVNPDDHDGPLAVVTNGGQSYHLPSDEDATLPSCAAAGRSDEWIVVPRHDAECRGFGKCQLCHYTDDGSLAIREEHGSVYHIADETSWNGVACHSIAEPGVTRRVTREELEDWQPALGREWSQCNLCFPDAGGDSP